MTADAELHQTRRMVSFRLTFPKTRTHGRKQRFSGELGFHSDFTATRGVVRQRAEPPETTKNTPRKQKGDGAMSSRVGVSMCVWGVGFVFFSLLLCAVLLCCAVWRGCLRCCCECCCLRVLAGFFALIAALFVV